MADVSVLPLANYPDGTQTFGLASIADNITQIILKFARCTTATPTIWPNETTILVFKSEISIDGGNRWDGISGFTAQGGIAFDRFGAELPFTLSLLIPPAGINRQIRGSLVVTGGPLRTQVFVSAS